jgi:hypothetical protein
VPTQASLLGSSTPEPAPARPIAAPPLPQSPAARATAPAAATAPPLRPAAPTGTPPARAQQPAGSTAAATPEAAPAGDLATAWQRVVEEVMGKKPLLGTILAQGKPLGVSDGELTLELTISQFQRDLLVDRANREIVGQAIRRSIAGADRFALASDNGGTGGGPAAHPAVQAAIAEFGGEVVAVRPRPREGEGQ